MGQIKKFYKYCKKDYIVEWIRLLKIKEKRLEILNITHINNLIYTTNDMYWQTYIVFSFEVGARFGEIRALRWKDIVDNYSVAEILTEKTRAGLKRIPLKMSSSYLMNLRIQTNADENDIIFPLSECRVLISLKEIFKHSVQTLALLKSKNTNCGKKSCETCAIFASSSLVLSVLISDNGEEFCTITFSLYCVCVLSVYPTVIV